MALEMTYNLQGDYPITAYVRIRAVPIRYEPSQTTKYRASISLEVKSAKEKNALDSWSSSSWDFDYDHTSNKNVIQQAYERLKSLPEFSTSIDKND